MSSILMPYLARALVAHYARAHGVARETLLPEQVAIRRRRDPGHDVAADAALEKLVGRVAPERLEVDVEPQAGVEPSELVAQAQVSVGDVGDPAPVAARGPEPPPQPLLSDQIPFRRDAARERVRHLGGSVPDQLDQLEQAGQDVERLEPRHDDRDAVPLDEPLEDRRAGDRRGVAG